MATQLQHRRFTEAQMSSQSGAQGELMMDTTNNRVVLHDSVTAGGHPTANLADVVDSSIFFDEDATSAADAYILTPSTSTRTPTAYFKGLEVGYVTAHTNTGASTVNFAGLGLKNIKTAAGADPGAGAISGRTVLIFDSVNNWFELQESNLSTAEESYLRSGRYNAALNSRFNLNSSGLTGVITLAGGEQAHDGWVAGASGCSYTFSVSAGATILTIASGTLKQTISGDRFETADHVLSWVGTAQAKIDVGSFGNSGTVTGSLSAGTPASIEFNTGTVTKVQLEKGVAVTDYLVKSNAAERSEFGSIGEGQTWQDMAASRALNADQTNNTGGPIEFRVLLEDNTVGGNLDITAIVDGVTVGRIDISDDGVNTSAAWVGSIVPNGATYRVNSSADVLITWSELR